MAQGERQMIEPAASENDAVALRQVAAVEAQSFKEGSIIDDRERCAHHERKKRGWEKRNSSIASCGILSRLAVELISTTTSPTATSTPALYLVDAAKPTNTPPVIQDLICVGSSKARLSGSSAATARHVI